MQNLGDMEDRDENDMRFEVELRGVKVRTIGIDGNYFTYSKEDIEGAFGRTIDAEALPMDYMGSPCPMFSYEKIKTSLNDDETLDMVDIEATCAKRKRSWKARRMDTEEMGVEERAGSAKRSDKGKGGGRRVNGKNAKGKLGVDPKAKAKEKVVLPKDAEKAEEDEKDKGKEKEKPDEIRERGGAGKGNGKLIKRGRIGRRNREKGEHESESEEEGERAEKDGTESGRGEEESALTDKSANRVEKERKRKRAISSYPPEEIEKRWAGINRRLVSKSRKVKRFKGYLRSEEEWRHRLETLLDESMSRNLRVIDMFLNDRAGHAHNNDDVQKMEEGTSENEEEEI